jgi:Capsule polysaccharide biosynthesis protein
VSWQSASLANRAPLAVARAIGSRALIFVNGPSLGRIAIADIDESENWSALVTLAATTRDFCLSDEQRAIALAHVREILDLHARFRPRETPLWSKGLISPLIACGYRALCTGSSNVDTWLAVVQWKQHWERVAWLSRRKLGLLPYHWLNRSERYIYFPMQNMADVKLTGRNPVYADQIALAEHIAVSLRPDLVLYIREHPNHPGTYDLARLKRLVRDRRVKLVHPHESNIALIRHAAAVVCVNSTAGWEAYTCQVPTVVLGNPFYRRSRLVFGVDNLNDMSRAIRRAVDEGPKLYRESQNEWLWFIWAALTTCAPGSPFGYKIIFGAVPKQDPIINGRLIGDALLERLEAMRQASLQIGTPVH